MSYRIAITDDNPADIKYIHSVLERWADARSLSVHIDSYPSAEAFLFQYEENPACDIILLDIEMPGMDGVTMAKGFGRRTVRR